MKKISLLLLLLQSLLLHAQEFKLSKTKEFDIENGVFLKVGDKYIKSEIIHGSMQLAYTFQLAKVRYDLSITSYDKDMNEVDKIFVDNDKKTLGPLRPYTFVLNNKLLIVYYRYMQEQEQIKAYISKVNPANLEIEVTKELFTIEQKNAWLFKSEEIIYSNNIFIRASPDSSKLLLVNANKSFIASCLIDEQLNATQKSIIVNKKELKDFVAVDGFVDNKGNKYFTYRYLLDGLYKNGLITESHTDGQAKFQEFKTMQGGCETNELSFGWANNNIYLHANYHTDHRIIEQHLIAGIMLTTVDSAFRISKPVLFEYATDLKEKLAKDIFAEKKGGNITVRQAGYTFNTLSNGTIVLTGSPVYGNGIIGPIITIFIKNNKADFYMLPRKTFSDGAHACITRVMDNKILLIYCDKEKHLTADLEKRPDYAKDPEELVLAAAVIDDKGNIISRKKIGDLPGDKKFYFLTSAFKFKPNAYVIPIGRNRTGMNKYYTEYNKLVELEIK